MGHTLYVCANDTVGNAKCEVVNFTTVEPKVISELPSGISAVLASDEGVDLTAVPQSGRKEVRLKKSGFVIADFNANFTGSMNWTSINLDSDPTTTKALLYVPAGLSEIAATRTLYVLKRGTNRVRICHGARTMAQVRKGCAAEPNVTSEELLDQTDSRVSVVTIDGETYWKITGLTGTGGIGENTIPKSAIGAANITWISETTETITGIGSESTQAGNITVLNFTVRSKTSKWAAYLGNVSGIIKLHDTVHTVFEWEWNKSENGGGVCAGTGTSYDWASLSNATPANVDAAWNFQSSQADSATHTFNGSSPMYIGGLGASGAFNTSAADTGPAGGFQTGLVEDTESATSKDDFLFCSGISQDGVNNSYAGTTVDYELIVPVTLGGTENYYFYVGLG